MNQYVYNLPCSQYHSHYFVQVITLSPEQNNVSDIGYMEGYTHIGSCYFIHPEVTQKYIDSIYDEIKHVAQQYDCRFGITKLATHGLTIDC